MNIFTQKAKLLKKIKSQKEKIQELKIEKDAFSNTEMTEVTIPPNVKEIAENNFLWGKCRTIYCVAGSEAQRYARENYFICKEIV